MKKWLWFFIFFLLISISCLYFVIPNRIGIHQSIGIAVNAEGFNRNVLNNEKWNIWWPANNKEIASNGQPQTLFFNGTTYNILEKRMSSVVLSVKNKNDSFLTELFFIPRNEDSVVLTWVAQNFASVNPVERIQIYYRTKKIGEDFKTILHHLKNFYEIQDNLYGINIKKELVIDSTLVSTAMTTKGPPTIENVYGLIDKLQTFVTKKGAKQTGHPMLNINTSDSLTFFTRVALPVDKKLSDEGDIVYRWMLGGGNILVTEVTGGPYKIQRAFAEMENYVQDFNRTAPAIPFQSLITDRKKETDTSKWVTKLYWPVM